MPVEDAKVSGPAFTTGTADLDDAELVAAVEGLTLGSDRFRHYDHVRLAWILLRGADLEAATDRMARALRRFAVHHGGDASRYHDTVTRAFMHLVAAHDAAWPAADFPTFARSNTELFDPRVLGAYYSPALLESGLARTSWVPPDRRPLP
jgi:hypothetical protein